MNKSNQINAALERLVEFVRRNEHVGLDDFFEDDEELELDRAGLKLCAILTELSWLLP